MRTLSGNDATFLGNADTEHSKAIAKIKDIMDKARAKKTLDFKTRMLSKPITLSKDKTSYSSSQHRSSGALDNRLLLQIYSQKDNLFGEK